MFENHQICRVAKIQKNNNFRAKNATLNKSGSIIDALIEEQNMNFSPQTQTILKIFEFLRQN